MHIQNLTAHKGSPLLTVKQQRKLRTSLPHAVLRSPQAQPYLLQGWRVLNFHGGDVEPRPLVLAEHKGMKQFTLIRKAAFPQQQSPQLSCHRRITPNPQSISVGVFFYGGKTGTVRMPNSNINYPSSSLTTAVFSRIKTPSHTCSSRALRPAAAPALQVGRRSPSRSSPRHSPGLTAPRPARTDQPHAQQQLRLRLCHLPAPRPAPPAFRPLRPAPPGRHLLARLFPAVVLPSPSLCFLPHLLFYFPGLRKARQTIDVNRDAGRGCAATRASLTAAR